MGLFSRKDTAPSDGQTGRARPSVSSEAQAAELRARARRRLAGAVALVLAAVIVLPMVLDSEPVPVADDIPIRIPDRDQPFQPQLSPPQLPAPAGQPEPAAAADAQDPGSAPADGASPPEPPLPGSQAGAGQAAQAPAAPPAPPATQPPAARPERPAPPPAPAAAPRQSDEAYARALLEGRSGAGQAAAPGAAGSGFVLQIAAYTAQADAQARRDKLHAAGVTNAFVQPVEAGGKRQYRLRVGPFPSRDAAQAAQARLRTLGYDNGFIAAQ